MGRIWATASGHFCLMQRMSLWYAGLVVMGQAIGTCDPGVPGSHVPRSGSIIYGWFLLFSRRFAQSFSPVFSVSSVTFCRL